MSNFITNILLFRPIRFKKLKKKFLNYLKSAEDEITEKFLQILLNLMRLYLKLNKNYRKNISDFEAVYQFQTDNKKLLLTVIFKNEKMQITEKVYPSPNVSLTFKDSRALINYLITPDPDILNSIWNQEIQIDGNMAYLLKFMYMARHLQLLFTGKL